MPGFADSFWSVDYAAGLGVLFGKLQQGSTENRQILAIARMRAEAEEAYGQRLGDIAPNVDKISGGFSRDDGATVRKAYDGVRQEMEDAAKSHRRIAQGIRDLVVNPFTRWCDAHEARVQNSQEELLSRIKAHDRQADAAKKLRATYFNKYRLVEDLEEENKMAFQDADQQTSPQASIPEIKVSPNKELDEIEEEPIEIGDDSYPVEQVKRILAHVLSTVKLGETKVPILGTYPNTTAGSDIVEYLQQHMNSTSVSYAERIGQDLITNGFLRLVGNVGNTFANSSRMFYQWRPKAFQFAGIPEKKFGLSRAFSMPATGAEADSAVVGTVSEYLAKWNVLDNPYPNETPTQRLQREAVEADDKYKAAVRRLDELRCELEEAIFVHLKFMERCELDRLKAVKTVILDFSGTISNVIPSLQSTVDKMLLFQETVQPASDLRYLVENYRTGSFIPRVVVYENYYNKVDEQIFGVDLEARARADKKRVPIIVTSILTYLDHHYPDLEGDEARRGVWLADVPLTQTHKLRARLVQEKSYTAEVFSEVFGESDIPTVASLLKLYLLELPDSLVSSHVYEIIRTVYTTPGTDTADGTRIPVLQQTLSQLRLTNIATLDACMNHFTRLIELTSADEAYISALVNMLGPCILRPRTETSLTLEEKHSYRLVRDLLTHKEAIFSELKRMSTLSYSPSTTGSIRLRAISTDESNRKAYMEERNRALLEKANGRIRATSPAPGPRGHRRDRSSAGPETRFPVQVTSPKTDRNRSSLEPPAPHRQSLEVPGELDNGATSAPAAAADAATTTNSPPNEAATAAPPAESNHQTIADRIDKIERRAGSPLEKRNANSTVEKRNSLGRSGAKLGSGRKVHASTLSLSHGTSHRAVTLEDKPMDD